MAFFKGIADTLTSLLPTIEITALTNDQFDQYKKQFATIEKSIFQVSKREEECKKFFYQLLYLHVKNADTINESVTREHAQKHSVTVKDLHFYLSKELMKQVEIKLLASTNKDQAEVLQKRKTRTSSSIISFKPNERKTFLNFVNIIFKDEPTVWPQIDINEQGQGFLSRFQDGIAFWYVPHQAIFC